MDITKLNFFNAVTGRMAWLQERQKVLAQNVAHADTPNYVAKDLKQPDFKTLLGQQSSSRLNVRATHRSHMSASPANTIGTQRFKIEPHAMEATPTGNAVILEEEIMKVAQTTVEFNVMTNLYRKGVSLMRIAITGRK